ncbi:MAG: cytochrome c3 family protein [Dissulfurispiraceae bacterium]|jgi:predicted CXXCH cytochrome family protein
MEAKRAVQTLLLIALAVVLVSGMAYAGVPDPSTEAQKCLECHSKQGIVIKFQDGKSEIALVAAEQFQLSAHGSLGCSSCHPGFSAEEHPARVFKSLEQFRIQSSRACRRCHSDDQLKSRSVHIALLNNERRGTPLLCADCHNAHAMTPTAGGKILKSESDYCMKCHDRHLKMVFKDNEALLLTVDRSLLQSSVHHELSCSDCHFGFSSKEHPKRMFGSRRAFTISSSETCRRCHFDKYSKTLESIHFAILNQGNLNAPVCTDCHGSHSIQKGRIEKLLLVKRCEKCHKPIFDIYAASVHGKALIDENNQDVPICIDCHRAHDISNPLTLEYRERIPEMCGNCHANKAIMGKYGISTDVLKTYLSDFHGVTLNFYKLQKDKLMKPGRPMATCVDCHGIHNISWVAAGDNAVIKARVVKQCLKCHEAADKNFPGAWLSHYEPSLKKAPLVFIVIIVCRAFIVLMVAGLVLQIVLHIWRYAIDR